VHTARAGGARPLGSPHSACSGNISISWRAKRPDFVENGPTCNDEECRMSGASNLT
jgi:hypothetical protein